MTFGQIPLSLKRIYPPIGFNDTVIISRGEEAKSIHGQPNCFEDAEIKEIHLSISPDSSGLEIRTNEQGKHLLQQQGIRACSAAAAAMMLLDHHKMIDRNELSDTNLGDDAFICRSLKRGGLQAVCSYLPSQQDPLSWLARALQDKGSAIVTLDSDFGAHVVIVDQVLKETGVRMRESYHGWDITLATEAFQKYWQMRSPIIQIDQT